MYVPIGFNAFSILCQTCKSDKIRYCKLQMSDCNHSLFLRHTLRSSRFERFCNQTGFKATPPGGLLRPLSGRRFRTRAIHFRNWPVRAATERRGNGLARFCLRGGIGARGSQTVTTISVPIYGVTVSLRLDQVAAPSTT